jgi:hypothetical protein
MAPKHLSTSQSPKKVALSLRERNADLATGYLATSGIVARTASTQASDGHAPRARRPSHTISLRSEIGFPLTE